MTSGHASAEMKLSADKPITSACERQSRKWRCALLIIDFGHGVLRKAQKNYWPALLTSEAIPEHTDGSLDVSRIHGARHEAYCRPEMLGEASPSPGWKCGKGQAKKMVVLHSTLFIGDDQISSHYWLMFGKWTTASKRRQKEAHGLIWCPMKSPSSIGLRRHVPRPASRSKSCLPARDDIGGMKCISGVF